MFFTREDILKIQNALLQLSVKDSELPSAESVTYDDTLSIVQESKNKQIKIKDLFNQISLWKREDFINITDKYDEHYISLIEAIKLVPILQRKDGLVITFQDIEGNWEIYQFRGNITEFFEEDKWFNLYDYRNNIIQSIVPDEEDLTASIPNKNGNSLVSLKDRTYNPASFSGKGYKILRKNIIDGNNILTQDMINQANTIYVIRYDFTLGEDITVPANCILEFEGGNISGAYTLIGQNTSIEANLVKIFNTNITIAGSWDISEAYPEWFGAKGDGLNDDYVYIQKSIDSFNSISLVNNYAISDTLTILDYRVIKANNRNKIIPINNIIVFDIKAECLIDGIIICLKSSFTNIAIKISKLTNIYEQTKFLRRGVIRNCTIERDFTVATNTATAILFYDNDNIGVYNWTIENCKFRYLDIAVIINAEKGYINSNTIQNCFFGGFKTVAKFVIGSDSTNMIRDNAFINCSFNNIKEAYDKHYMIFDIPTDSRISQNKLDVYLWDIEINPNGLGSQIGRIGFNQLDKNIFNLYGYLNTTGNLTFIGALNSGSSYGSSFVELCMLTVTSKVYIKLSASVSALNVISFTQINNVDYGDGDDYNNTLCNLYYILQDGIYYLYSGGIAGVFELSIIKSFNFINTKLNFNTSYINKELATNFATAHSLKGRSSKRPVLSNNFNHKGFLYFDTSLNKPIYWTGSAWVDTTGASV